MDMVRTGAFFFGDKGMAFFGNGVFFFMCINLLAISGSAARFLAESGVCVCVCVCVWFFLLTPSHSHTYIRRRH
jgi:hypothetical protein